MPLRPRFFSALLMLVLVAAWGSIGCGGGSSSGPVGTLEVTNDAFSTDVVDQVDIDDVFSPNSYSFLVDLFPNESIQFDLYPSTYDVTIFWSTGVIDFYTVDIFDGFVTPLLVSN